MMDCAVCTLVRYELAALFAYNAVLRIERTIYTITTSGTNVRLNFSVALAPHQSTDDMFYEQWKWHKRENEGRQSRDIIYASFYL
jgi:hypothetical protein